jgi:hypothetical protein
MKAYYEYDDGTFWAIRAEGCNCFTWEGSKYGLFLPEQMLKVGTEEGWRITQKVAKISFESPEAAEREAVRMAAVKSADTEKQDAEF